MKMDPTNNNNNNNTNKTKVEENSNGNDQQQQQQQQDKKENGGIGATAEASSTSTTTTTTTEPLSVAQKILAIEPSIQVDLTVRKKDFPTSTVPRFPMNPEKNWGPKPRASGKRKNDG